ncbi:hypothetical protein ACFL2X_07235 [Candidatus Latescibacterota bacterium]
MKSLLIIFGILSILVVLFCIQCSSPEIITLDVRYSEQNPADSIQYLVKHKTETLPTNEVAIILDDVWNNHSCISAANRVNEIAPVMNEVVKAARGKGIFIIHAPSECMDYYKDTPQRKLAQNAPYAQAPFEIKRRVEDSDYEPPLPGTLGNMECACDTEENCRQMTPKEGHNWTKQNDAIEIALGDAISDDGQEIYNMLEQRGIDNVIIMGFHTNICMVRRSFGIRQMVYNGKNIILCRDMTDQLNRNPRHHFEDLQLIIEHIEKYWCPSITSESITGKPSFRFKDDHTTGS